MLDYMKLFCAVLAGSSNFSILKSFSTLCACLQIVSGRCRSFLPYLATILLKPSQVRETVGMNSYGCPTMDFQKNLTISPKWSGIFDKQGRGVEVKYWNAMEQTKRPNSWLLMMMMMSDVLEQGNTTKLYTWECEFMNNLHIILLNPIKPPKLFSQKKLNSLNCILVVTLGHKKRKTGIEFRVPNWIFSDQLNDALDLIKLEIT